MKIVVCGAGQVGFNIARHLSMEGNDVIVIDTSPELIRRINDNLDAQGVVGHASRPDVLERAGIGDADMIIAVTHTDEVNMVACQVAHSLFEVPMKIARVREQSYLDPAWSNLFSRDHLPIDVIISPGSGGGPRHHPAAESARLLRNDPAGRRQGAADRSALRRPLPPDQHADQAAHAALPRPQYRHRRPACGRTSRCG